MRAACTLVIPALSQIGAIRFCYVLMLGMAGQVVPSYCYSTHTDTTKAAPLGLVGAA